MTAIDLPLARTGYAPPAALAFDLAIVEDVTAIEDLWRGFEAGAMGTPYQRYDFVRAYLDTLGREEGVSPRVVIGRDALGGLAFLMPLGLRRRGPLRVAAPVGGRHANFHGPLWRPGLRIEDPAALLGAIGALVDADAVTLPALPRRLDGEPHPFVPADAPRAASNAYGLSLPAGGEDALAGLLSREARKKLRAKERRLAEIGPVALRQAHSRGEVETILAALLAHKAERRRGAGVPNPFEAPRAEDFLRRACLAGLAEGTPAVELYGLFAGERVVATFTGVGDAARLCGMTISFDADPEIARASPGELLLLHLIPEQARRGRRAFDLGVGEARYKERYSDEAIGLADVTVPVTAAGTAYATAARLPARLKCALKRRPWAWSIVTRLRARAMAEG